MKKFTRIEPTVEQIVGLKFKQHVIIKKFQTDDGLKHEFTTIYKEGTHAAAVIALTPDNRAISVYQFRPNSEEWVYDLPGGGVYAGEDPEVGALRELKEETGYVPGEMRQLGVGYFDAYTNVKCHYYLATNCTLDSAGTTLDDEENEQGVEVRLMSISELIENAKAGTMSDPRAVLQAYETLKELERL